MFTPTAEQTSALDLFKTGENLAIEAGAGTGKTSTLRLLAEQTTRRGQYIAFNKAIVTEAGEKMPGSVRCSTAHSLAFREVGKLYAHRLKSPRVRSLDIANRLGIDPLFVTRQDGERKSLSRGYLAGLTMRAVTRFCQSADLEPGEQHVPYIDGIDVPPGRFDNQKVVRRHILPAMRQAWADFQDPRGSLPYRHDHYPEAEGRTPEAHAERTIEQRRKAAIRASWLDCRSSGARDHRARAMRSYNTSLRFHLERWHPEVELPDSEWELDALHEELHGREVA